MIFRKSALERLAVPEDLDELMQVTTPRAWLAILGFGLLLLAGVVWSALTSLDTTVHAQGVVASPGREALLFLTPEQAGQVRRGMPAKVTLPVLVNGAAQSLSGRVTSVGQYPLDAPTLAHELGSPSSAGLPASTAQLLPVRIALLHATPIPGAVHRTPCRADITVSSRRLIRVIVP